jgi:hypothetical protein
LVTKWSRLSCVDDPPTKREERLGAEAMTERDRTRPTDERLREAPEPRPASPWSTWAQSFTLVIREGDERGEGPCDRAVTASYKEIDADLPLEEFVPELQRWLANERGDFFNVTTSRRHLTAGASFVGAELLIVLLGTTAGTVAGIPIAEALLAFVKERLGLRHRGGGARIEYLRSLDPGDAESYVSARVARAIDCRRSDLTLVEFVLDENEARAVYDVGDDRYEVRVDHTAYRILRVEPTDVA